MNSTPKWSQAGTAGSREVDLAVDVFVGFEARTGKRVELREELMRILEPAPAQAGALGFICMSVCVPGRISSYILNGWRRRRLMHMRSYRTGRGFGIVVGADYASGAGDEVQELRLGAVKT